MTRYLGIGEAARAVGLTPRQLRYLGLGALTAADGGRLYDPEGVALLVVYREVASRFSLAGLPAWKARAALLYLEADLRAAFRRRSASVLVLDVDRGLARITTSAPTRETAIALRTALDEARELIASVRATSPALWTGKAFSTEPALLM